jgi:hypothetical protein
MESPQRLTPTSSCGFWAKHSQVGRFGRFRKKNSKKSNALASAFKNRGIDKTGKNKAAALSTIFFSTTSKKSEARRKHHNLPTGNSPSTNSIAQSRFAVFVAPAP